MFREMRRKNYLLLREEVYIILYHGTFEALAVAGNDNAPYTKQISCVYDG